MGIECDCTSITSVGVQTMASCMPCIVMSSRTRPSVLSRPEEKTDHVYGACFEVLHVWRGHTRSNRCFFLECYSQTHRPNRQCKSATSLISLTL